MVMCKEMFLGVQFHNSNLSMSDPYQPILYFLSKKLNIVSFPILQQTRKLNKPPILLLAWDFRDTGL